MKGAAGGEQICNMQCHMYSSSKFKRCSANRLGLAQVVRRGEGSPNSEQMLVASMMLDQLARKTAQQKEFEHPCCFVNFLKCAREPGAHCS